MATIQSAVKLRTNDPIQGHDVFVAVNRYETARYASQANATGDGGGGDDAILNAFSDVMFKIVNQTETYLPLFSRVPRYLDGEVIIVWSLSAGTISLNFIKQTFGGGFATALEKGRQMRIPRSARFSITCAVSTGEFVSSEAGFFNPEFAGEDDKQVTHKVILHMCRCDTLSFGVASGKGYAVNAWQGTAEGIEVKLKETGTLDPDTSK